MTRGQAGCRYHKLAARLILNREQHKTIIMVTHDPKAAEFASRQLHVDKGQLVDAGIRTAA